MFSPKQEKLVEGCYLGLNLFENVGNALAKNAGEGDVDSLKLLLSNSNSVSIDTRDDFGNTALHWAACNDKFVVVEFLLSQKADPLAKNTAGETPVHLARAVGAKTSLKLLLKALEGENNVVLQKTSASAAGSSEAVDASLVEALYNGDIQCVLMALERGANPNVKLSAKIAADFESSLKPLHAAAMMGLTSLVHMLTHWGAKCRDDEGGPTPVCLAAASGHFECVGALLDLDDDPFCANASVGTTALHWAAAGGWVLTIRTLVQKCPRLLSASCKQGMTPLHYAASCDKSKAVRTLIAQGIVWSEDADGRSPLHWACEYGNEQTVRALLMHPQFKVNGTTSKRNFVESAAHVCARRKRQDLLDILLASGADANAVDSSGLTPAQIIANLSGLRLVRPLSRLSSSSTSLADAAAAAAAAPVRPVPARVPFPALRVSSEGYQNSRQSVVSQQDAFLQAVLTSTSENTKHPEELELFLNREVNSNICMDGRGSRLDRKTALHLACGRGKLGAALLLIHFGSKLTCIDEDGNTPIHDASAAGHAELVKTLIRLGASPWVRNRFGDNPLMLAVKKGHAAVVGALSSFYLEFEEYLNVCDVDDENVLHMVCRLAPDVQAAIAGVLMQSNKLQVNAVNVFGQTSLLLAAQQHGWELLKLLLSDSRCNVNVKDGDGCPFLVWMFDQEEEPPAEVLETVLGRSDVVINAKDATRGFTALHVSESRGRETHVALLLSAGADKDIQSQNGSIASELRPAASKKPFFQSLFKGRKAQQPQQQQASSDDTKSDPMVVVFGNPASPPPPTITSSSVATKPSLQSDALNPVAKASSAKDIEGRLLAKVMQMQPTAQDTRSGGIIQNAMELLRQCNVTRSYTPPGVESLPKPVQTWRDDLKALRVQQQQTGHMQDSQEVAKSLVNLENQTNMVESYAVRPNISLQELQSFVNARQEGRQRSVQLMKKAIGTGKTLWELQAKELDVLTTCGADRREDDESISCVDALLDRVTQAQEALLEEKTTTNKLLKELEAQIEREKGAFERWRVLSEHLVHINRLIDMRRHLSALRLEMHEQEIWLTNALAQEALLEQTLARTHEAEDVAKRLQEATRILQRRTLELEEACRYRDLLMREGAAASEAELKEAESRVKVSRARYAELKGDHDELIDKANTLGRAGFPEVWSGTSAVLRGGALLSLDSFSNVMWLRSPDVRIGERDGKRYVLKSRVVSEKVGKIKLEKEIHVMRRLRHPLIMTLDTVFQQGDTYFMVMPYYEDGTLQKWLDQKPAPSRDRVRNVFRGLCQALTFLHANDVVHADIKPDNVLMSGDQPILSDFDIARDASFFSSTQATTLHAPGTLSFMAPELFEYGQKPSFATDLWSFGVCLFQAHFPDTQVYLAPKALHVQVPQDRDVALRALLEQLLSRDPTARLSADQVLSAPYFRTVVDEHETQREAATLDAFREMLRLLKSSSSRSFALRWKINPATLVPDALQWFASLTGSNQTKPIKVVFEGEKGYDSGGLATSLYRRFFSEIFLKETALFESRGGSTYLPLNTADPATFHSIGIAIARCLFDERIIDLPLSSACLKFFFNSQVDFSDLEAFDESQATHLKMLIRCPNVENMGLTFAYAGGSEEEVVTDLNKEQFIRKKIVWDLIESRRAQLERMREGFWSFSTLQKPLSLLRWRDLVVLLCGSSFLSAEMLLSSIVYDNFPLVHMFQAVVKSLTVDDLRLLLFFATESPAIPFGGLQNPRGHVPIDRITIRGDKRASTTQLPSASVCFYTISMPLYETEQVMKDKLLLAIRECGPQFDYR